MTALAQTLADIVQRNGWTMIDLSRRSGVQQSSLSRASQGRGLSPDSLSRIIAACAAPDGHALLLAWIRDTIPPELAARVDVRIKPGRAVAETADPYGATCDVGALHPRARRVINLLARHLARRDSREALELLENVVSLLEIDPIKNN